MDIEKNEYLMLSGGLWVQVEKVEKKKNRFHFHVINGHWDGHFDLDKGQIYIKYTGARRDARIITRNLTRQQVRTQSGY